MSFLLVRKNIHDKFFDVVKEYITIVPFAEDQFKRKGMKELSNQLEVSVATLSKYIKQGFINESNETLYINIERNFDKIKKIKRQRATTTIQGFDKNEPTFDFKAITKQFTIHNFTLYNFFKRKPFGRIKKTEQLYFRAGLYIVFRSGKKGFYTIQNLPISHYSNKYPQGYTEFFDIIKIKLIDYPSLLFFRFNYFDVQKIDLSAIDEPKIIVSKKTKRKYTKSVRKKKK